MNLLMKKLGKTDHSQWLQKNQIARNKFNKGGEHNKFIIMMNSLDTEKRYCRRYWVLENLPHSWTGRINALKVAVLPNL